MAHGFGRMIGVMALVLLGGCGTCGSGCSDPYIFAPPRPNLEGATTFAIRYSEWRNTKEEVVALIARQCGPGFATARLYVQPYQGTALHPQQATVICGNPPPPPPAYPGQEVDPGALVELR